MNLRELEYLVALADHRNFRRAAEVCGVSQPTLSTQLRKLEAELGATLVERAPRNVLLTPAGEAAVARARRVLIEIAQLREEAVAGRRGATRLRLGVFPTLGPYLLPSVVPRFVARFPEVELRLTEEKSEALRRKLIKGELDAALLALPVTDSHLTGAVLFDEPFHLAVPRGHPLAARERVRPDALSNQRLMLLEEGHCLRDQALALCQRAGATEHAGFRGTSLETLRQMVVAGVGMTLLPALACGGAGTSEIEILPFAGAGPSRRIGLFWRRSTATPALMRDLAALLREIAGDLVPPVADTAAATA